LALAETVRAGFPSISALVRVHPTTDPRHEIEIDALLEPPLPGLLAW
jgi:hypothetical protein